MLAEPLLARDFIARARPRLRAAPPHPPDDGRALRAAAVLIPIVDRPDGASVVFTLRATGLRSHFGQIAFPGGKIDGEEDALAAALRETREEIGLDATFVTPAGYLDLYPTNTGYRITPVVAVVAPGFALALNPDEVEDSFECPLAFLMDATRHRRETRTVNGAMRSFYAMPFGPRYIWGVTAGIVRSLYECVYA